MRISDWSSDVCSSDLLGWHQRALAHAARLASQSSTLTVFSLVIASTPSAIANATMPSMRPVAFDLSSFRFPAGSGTATAFAAHIASAGCPPCRRRSCNRRSEEHTSELQSLMRISYAVFCLKKKTIYINNHTTDKADQVTAQYEN